MDRNNLSSSESSLKVSADVVSGIAATAVKEVKGVADVSGKGRSLRHLIIKDKNTSDISVKFNGGVLEISVSIDVLSGTKVKPCAEAVQNKVKQDVQDMTGITVSKVNVTVAGIIFPDKKQS